MEDSAGLSRDDLDRLFTELEAVLAQRNIRAQIQLFGGAAIILAYHADRLTDDVAAVFAPRDAVLDAASTVAQASYWQSRGLSDGWLNDDVSRYLPFTWLELAPDTNARFLEVSIAEPEQLLAMKLLASRSSDKDDIALLVQHLGLTSTDDCMAIMDRYYPKALLMVRQRARLLVDSLFRAPMRENSSPRPDSCAGENAVKTAPRPETVAGGT